jgi:hypothetical protein
VNRRGSLWKNTRATSGPHELPIVVGAAAARADDLEVASTKSGRVSVTVTTSSNRPRTLPRRSAQSAWTTNGSRSTRCRASCSWASVYERPRVSRVSAATMRSEPWRTPSTTIFSMTKLAGAGGATALSVDEATAAAAGGGGVEGAAGSCATAGGSPGKTAASTRVRTERTRRKRAPGGRAAPNRCGLARRMAGKIAATCRHPVHSGCAGRGPRLS